MIRYFVLILLLAIPAAAQTPAAIERELLGYLKTMADTGSYSGNYDGDKLDAATEALKTKLLKYAERADVLAYAFPELKTEMFIATSKDGKFRVYSWDLQSGGTMHDYDQIVQYVGMNGKTAAWSQSADDEVPELGGFFTNVFQVATPRGPIYLLVSTSRASTSLNAQSINAVRVDGDELDLRPEIIRTPSGLTNSITFAYDFFSVVDRKERPIRLFTFNESRKEFRFPIVIEDEKTPQGRVTNRFITYRFNGTHFVKVS